MEGVIPRKLTGVDVLAVAAAFADGIRRFVGFAAEHPELNQIMVHEGTAASDRFVWMTETHVKPVSTASGQLGSCHREMTLLPR